MQEESNRIPHVTFMHTYIAIRKSFADWMRSRVHEGYGGYSYDEFLRETTHVLEMFAEDSGPGPAPLGGTAPALLG